MMSRAYDKACLDKLIRVTVWALCLAYCGLVWAFVGLVFRGWL